MAEEQSITKYPLSKSFSVAEHLPHSNAIIEREMKPMNHIEIPKGWRKLRVGERIKSGDLALSIRGNWIRTSLKGLKFGDLGTSKIYIRKIQKQEKPRRQNRQKRWVNLYPDGHWDSSTTKQVADLCASSRIAVVKVMM